MLALEPPRLTATSCSAHDFHSARAGARVPSTGQEEGFEQRRWLPARLDAHGVGRGGNCKSAWAVTPPTPERPARVAISHGHLTWPSRHTAVSASGELGWWAWLVSLADDTWGRGTVAQVGRGRETRRRPKRSIVSGLWRHLYPRGMRWAGYPERTGGSAWPSHVAIWCGHPNAWPSRLAVGLAGRLGWWARLVHPGRVETRHLPA